MKQIRGFTLIELLVTLSILAIIATMAAPSFNRVIRNVQIDSDVSGIRNALTLARSEAISRQTEVAICSYDISKNSNIFCNGDKNWATGWVVFVDADNDHLLNNNDTVLRVWDEGIKGSGSMIESSGRTVTSFAPTGAVADTAEVISLVLEPTADCGVGEKRTISINNVGRMSISEGDCS